MFDYRDLTIGVIGHGISGSYIACMLAKDRYRVTLFSQDGPPTNPSPVLILPKTYLDFLLFKVFKKKYTFREIHDVRLVAPNGREAQFSLEDPLLVLQRDKLTGNFIELAQESGARVCSGKITSIQEEDGFILEAKGRKFGADFLIGADGTNSLIRKTMLNSSVFPMEKERHSLVYTYLPGVDLHEFYLHFLADLPGYVWFLPIQQGIWAGIRQFSPHPKIDLLEKTLFQHCRHHFGRKSATFQPHHLQIPLLRQEEFQFQMYMGPTWALVGSAAGLIDPLTGLGSGEAIKSSYYFCDAFSKIRPSQYPGQIKNEIFPHLMGGLDILPHLQNSRFTNFLISSFDKSPAIRKLVTSIFTGHLPYHEGKKLYRSSRRSIYWEVLCHGLGWPCK